MGDWAPIRHNCSKLVRSLAYALGGEMEESQCCSCIRRLLPSPGKPDSRFTVAKSSQPETKSSARDPLRRAQRLKTGSLILIVQGHVTQN